MESFAPAHCQPGKKVNETNVVASQLASVHLSILPYFPSDCLCPSFFPLDRRVLVCVPTIRFFHFLLSTPVLHTETEPKFVATHHDNEAPAYAFSSPSSSPPFSFFLFLSVSLSFPIFASSLLGALAICSRSYFRLILQRTHTRAHRNS